MNGKDMQEAPVPGASSTALTTLERVMGQIKGAESPDDLNAAWDELLESVKDDEEAIRLLCEEESRLVALHDDARIRLAGVVARLGGIVLAIGDLVEPPGSHPEFAQGGPATEMALAALYCLEHAGAMVKFSPEAIEAALAEPEADPNFADYPAVYAATVAHLETAAYYLLNPVEAHAALASEPPEQETFPPLPFPRIWIEMTHLSPYMRFQENPDKYDYESEPTQPHTLDILGVALAEIDQGRVWDIYAPFVLDNKPEFFILAGRITPAEIVASDATVESAPYAFAHLRALAIGGVHLITARNVISRDVTLPRHQRKRLAAALPRLKPRLYYVDLASAGERESGYGGSREYTVRWLVRGHWRHVSGGRRFCTCCSPPQVASWVEPYVKGPVGAPWKGRQVRREIPA